MNPLTGEGKNISVRSCLSSFQLALLQVFGWFLWRKRKGKQVLFFFLFPFLGTDNVLCRDTSIPDALNSSTPLEAFGNGSHSFAEWLPLVMTSG